VSPPESPTPRWPILRLVTPLENFGCRVFSEWQGGLLYRSNSNFKIVGVATVMFDKAAMPQGLGVPAKNLPVPGTPSPQIQKLIGAPLWPGWNVLPKSGQEWQQVVATRAAATLKALPGLIERMKVKVEKTTIDGVRAFIVTPESTLPNNRDRVLIHITEAATCLVQAKRGSRRQ
jgi:hypothetical protein